ncbi:CsbD family protein [Marinibaculum pumilum]|uniref:CsbD family protein n=1 Tax=Marinibaculum pumilum TaxID=1766165 RepID=A0ABV7L005_9PROT
MNWDQVEGNWKKFTGEVRQQWGKLTDDEVHEVGGNREKLEGKIQERYGQSREDAKRDVDLWLARM